MLNCGVEVSKTLQRNQWICNGPDPFRIPRWICGRGPSPQILLGAKWTLTGPFQAQISEVRLNLKNPVSSMRPKACFGQPEGDAADKSQLPNHLTPLTQIHLKPPKPIFPLISPTPTEQRTFLLPSNPLKDLQFLPSSHCMWLRKLQSLFQLLNLPLVAVGSFPAELRREDSELDLKIGLLASENGRIGRWSIQSLVTFFKIHDSKLHVVDL